MSDHHHTDHAHHHHEDERGTPSANLAAHRWSLLRVSALDRLIAAAGIILLMWSGVWWAFR